MADDLVQRLLGYAQAGDLLPSERDDLLTAADALARTLDAAPADPVVSADARIDGLIRVGDSFPRLFITTPDGVRKEIRRIEYMDVDDNGKDKYPAWTSSLAKEQSRGR